MHAFISAAADKVSGRAINMRASAGCVEFTTGFRESLIRSARGLYSRELPRYTSSGEVLFS